MAGRKELFCASSSPVTLSALINACCTETILQLFSLRSSCCPSDAAHAASSGQQLLLREKSFRIVSASSRRYMAGWKSYWTSTSTEKLHCVGLCYFSRPFYVNIFYIMDLYHVYAWATQGYQHRDHKWMNVFPLSFILLRTPEKCTMKIQGHCSMKKLPNCLPFHFLTNCSNF